VRAAEDGRHAMLPQSRGQFICSWCGAGDHREPGEIDVECFRQISDSFIDEGQLRVQLRRHQRGQCRQRERLIAQRFAKNPPAMAIERPLGRDESDAQRAIASHH
jgi:hypothetical protein